MGCNTQGSGASRENAAEALGEWRVDCRYPPVRPPGGEICRAIPYQLLYRYYTGLPTQLELDLKAEFGQSNCRKSRGLNFGNWVSAFAELIVKERSARNAVVL